MKVSWHDIRVLYGRELRSAFRESNVVLYSVIVPLLLYPLMVWLMISAITFVSGQQEKGVSRIFLTTPPPPPHTELLTLLEESEKIELVKKLPGEPEESLRRGQVDLVVEFQPFRVLAIRSRSRSELASSRFKERLRLHLERFREAEARRLKMESLKLQPFWVEGNNISSSTEVGRYLLGVLLPFTLIVVLSLGVLYPAIDSTAGEKERGTWQTALTCATEPINLVVAKYLYVTTMAALAGFLNLGAMLFSVRSLVAPFSRDLADQLQFSIPPSALLVIAVGTLAMAGTLAGASMLVASFARGFREGQTLVTPFFMFSLLPIALLADNTLHLSWGWSLVPVVNVALAWREAINGIYQWPLFGLTLLVQLVCLVVCLALARRVLAYEDFLLGEFGGSITEFVKRRLWGRR